MDEPISKWIKRRNPREGANKLSILTFFYTFKTFFRGWKNGITQNDLYETLSEHQSAVLGGRALHLWEKLKNPSYSALVKMLMRLFRWEFLLIGGSLVLEILILQPLKAILVGKLISYYSGNQSADEAHIYSLSLIVTAFLTCMITQPCYMGSYHLGLKIKIVCSCLVYNKILKMSASALNHVTPGHIINLIATDVNCFEHVGYSINFIWIAPFQLLLMSYLIWREIGFSSLLGIGFLSLFTLVYVQLRNILARFRSKVAMRRDERIRLTNELIQGVSVIKMYAWEEAFSKLISQFRNLEVNAIRKFTYCKGLFSFAYIFGAVAIFIAITSSTTVNVTINAKTAFVSITLFYSLSTTLISFIPTSIAIMAEVKVCLQRLSTFLLCDEIDSGFSSEEEKSAVFIKNGCAKWEEKGNKNSLENLNIEIKANSLTAVIGAVGSGKTSLCQVIQKELPLSQGNLIVNGSLSCASQEIWIFSASIRQNILFGGDMDEKRYEEVIRCCALDTDLNQFPYGDKTIVGERGASLSGGQKARISLARCVYRNADIYLLDDPLSAVDVRVGQHIFRSCIQKFLKEKTVILVTHQIQYLSNVNEIIALDNGKVQFQGSEGEMNRSNLNFSKFLSENQPSNHEFECRIKNDEIESPKQVEETKNSGFIEFSTYKNYLFASKNYALVILALIIPLAAEVAASGSFYFVRYWVNVEQDGQHVTERNIYIFIYCGIVAIAIILAIVRLILLTKLTMESSKSLHNFMFANLLRSPLAFFQSNPSGRILNRFTKDLLMIDEMLPNVSLIAITLILNILGLLVVICAVNPWFLIPTVVLVVGIWGIRRFYLATNLDILRVESVARSPVYNYIQSTLQGLSTIRAFQVQDILLKEFYEHLDTHSTSVYMSYSVSRAFGYWIDVLSLLFVITAIIFYVFVNEPYGGNVGMVLSQALRIIGTFPYGIRQLTDVENCMVSVERILEYGALEQERDIHTHLSPTWPTEGGIQFISVCLKYTKNGPLVLNNLNFVVKPSEKVGIVGRTGAGKSSIISALFQLVETEGSIIIDGVDITSVNLTDLRKKISIIPQDPVLFSGTVRSNLDPFDEFHDGILWKALEDVQLKKVISSLPSGLSSLVSHDGSNLSIGQRQLLCLARAIVRNNKILILDEATANVDMKTDEIIQRAIRTKFAKCTVLTVAHRINTIIDTDKILVIDGGKLVEFDHPNTLLNKSDGFFSNIVRHDNNYKLQT